MVDERPRPVTIDDPSRSVPFRAILILSDPDDLPDLIERAGNVGGKIGVMIRDAEHRPAEVARLVRSIDPEAISPGVVPIVNAPPVDLAIPPGWWVHLPAAMTPRGADLPGPFGSSVHSIAELDGAERAGAAYVVAGPIWPTHSKPGHPGIGIELFSRLCDRSTRPVFGLGGITDADRVAQVLAAGAFGFACRSCGTDAMPNRLNEMLARLDDRASGPEVRNR